MTAFKNRLRAALGLTLIVTLTVPAFVLQIIVKGFIAETINAAADVAEYIVPRFRQGIRQLLTGEREELN